MRKLVNEAEELIFQLQLITYVDVEVIRHGHGKELPKLKDLVI